MIQDRAAEPTGIEEELGIVVVKEELTATYRQTVSLTKKDRAVEALAYLQSKLAESRKTAKLALSLNQGGMRSVVTEETTDVPIGGAVEKMLDVEFGK
jgi:hypothetical protein